MDKYKHNIQLTQDEQIIFHTLKTYRNELGLKTVLRVAGGWVRDKVILSFYLTDHEQTITRY